ncbi:MAG: hypothetical protein R3324_11075, partial [Halobacteriales archaeon]|nr:hypothetical protein [Halobacteriales archaeon]
MTTTDNHGYNAPERGTENWDVPLNENFAALDAEMEVRDVEANRGNYTPKAGAKFLSIDTGIVSIGDGTEWQEAMALPRFNSPPSGESEWAGNVVMGHPSNRIDSDAAGGATIAGGGLGLDDGPNVVEGAFGTIGGGAANSVSNPYGTVSGGFLNTAGEGAAVGGGAENTASAGATVGGGEGNTASALYATVSGGNNNTASEFVATVAGGSNNTASGRYSFAAGSEAKARHRGSFVWNDSSDAEFGSTGDNQFLIRATGGVGIGTNEPRNPLDVRADPSGGARIVNHVMVVENTSDEGEGDVLALKTNSRDPGSGANLITFKSANADIGAIEGDGGGGVTLKSGGADYAELLPRRNPDETFKPGAVVGLTRGKLIRDTAGADRVMVVSEQASVVGNDPGEDAREDYTPVAFVGQVRTKVRGRVESGDLIV